MSGPVLVVGGDGLIGMALATEFQANRQTFIATTRRKDGRGLSLDLAKPDEWEIPPDLDAAVLCAAATNLGFCRDNPEAARQINVINTLRLAEELSRQGAFISFLSTNLVFDGEIPRIAGDAPLNPRTVYGELKAEAERGLPDVAENFAIIRLSKVFTQDMPLLLNWRRQLDAGEILEPFVDYRCSPIDLTTAARAIAMITTQRRSGIWQLCPENDVSYADIAHETASRLGVPANRIKPIPSTAKTELEHIPKHTTLDASRAREEMNLEFPPMPVVLDRVWDS